MAEEVVKVEEKKIERKHRKSGRPLLFKKKMLMDAELLCQLGLTEENLATYWGVSSRTVIRWKKKNPQLCHAIEKGRLNANIAVSRKMFETATQGNLGAMVFWLTNRMSEAWRDRRGGSEAKAVFAEFGGEASDVRQLVKGWGKDKKNRFVQVLAKVENEMGVVDREIEKEEIKNEIKQEDGGIIVKSVKTEEVGNGEEKGVEGKTE